MRASLAFLLCLCAPLTARADFWTVTDLGSFPGGVPVAQGINDLGWVVGTSWQTPGGPMRAFLWRDGVMQDLGAPPGHSDATAVNNRGQVVGASIVSGLFVWEGGVFRILPTLGGSGGGVVQAISQNGLIAGASWTPGNVAYHAALWQGNTILDLGTLGGPRSAASGVNSRGQVVGVADTDPFGRPHAFLWENGVMRSLGTLGGFNSEAAAINELGWVAGMSHILGGSPRAFFWQDGVMTNLGTLGGTQSWANDLNDLGWVVGRANLATSAGHAFLWRDGVMLDLNDLLPPDSGWVLLEASGVNNLGQIIGVARNQGRSAAFLLTPPEVPEPTAFALLGAGIVTLLAYGYCGRATAQPGRGYLLSVVASKILVSTKL